MPPKAKVKPKVEKIESPLGRPSKYVPEFDKRAYKLCLLGATDKHIADILEVDVATINRWKISIPSFCDSLKAGKDDADAVIAQSLYHRAKGYYHPEDKIFNDGGTPMVVPTTKHYPPDTTAAIFWLKNRQPKAWRDRQEVEHSGAVGVQFVDDLK